MVTESIAQHFTSAASQPLLPELWLEIFFYLSNDDINNASLTCQSFYLMAQPLLFRVLTFRPYIFQGGYAGYWEEDPPLYCRRPLNTRTMRRNRLRLEFCTSDRIAPAVRRIIISPTRGIVRKNEGAKCDSILRAIVHCLPRLVNLVEVDCELIWWPHELWKEFCTVRRLQTLNVRDCSLDINGPKERSRGTLSVSRLTVTSSDLVQFAPGDWLSVLHADRIDCMIGHSFGSSLFDINWFASSVRHLQSLTTRVRPETLPTLSDLVEKSPPLCTLKLFLSYVTVDHVRGLPCIPLPDLRTYYGPYELLRKWSNNDTLRHLHTLSLCSLSNDGPVEIRDNLQELAKSAIHLQSLTFSCRDITEQLLITVLSQFNQLKHLYTFSTKYVDLNQAAEGAYTYEVGWAPIITISIDVDIWTHKGLLVRT